MKTIAFKLPENLKECDSIHDCTKCYLAKAQITFNWSPIVRDCFFRKEFVDYEFLIGDFSRGKDMNEIELVKYKKIYKPNEKWLEIIKNNLENIIY